jgi:hypothetical protein
MQSSLIQGGFGNNHILDVQHKQEDVFGYRFEICKDCLLTDTLEVRFGKDGTKDNNNNNNDGAVDVVARIEQKHECDPKLVASNRKEVLDKEGSVSAMVDELPGKGGLYEIANNCPGFDIEFRPSSEEGRTFDRYKLTRIIFFYQSSEIHSCIQ